MQLWMPEAIKHDVGSVYYGSCDQDKPPKGLGHITWDENATKSAPLPLVPFARLVTYFSNNVNLCPHLLWNPFDGSIAQFFPANSRSMSLVDLPGNTRTNRAGKVVIQVEALFFPYCIWKGKTYAKLTDTPCVNWDKIQKWTTGLGIPNRWPMGMPNGTSQRNEHIWETEGGWYGHSQVPENTHTDPITWPNFVVIKAPVKTIPPFPGAKYFKLNAVNNYVTEVDRQLVRLHFTKHNDGNGYQPGPRYTGYTRDNVKDFQKSRGWSGNDADGFVGPQTWHDLHAL